MSQTTAPAAPPRVFTHRQILVVMSGLLMGMLLAALDQTIVATALPAIVSDLGGLQHIAWVTTAYLLTATVSTPLYGKLGDLYGRKHLFQVAIIIFLIGSMLSGLSQTMGQLIVFRGIQGLGAGGLMVLAMAIVADVIPPRDRGRYQGLFGAVFGAASVAGPLLGGLFTDHLSWHWVFYINVPIGIAALVVTSAVLPNTRSILKPRIDWTGAALLTGAIGSLVLLTTWGGSQYAWTSPTILALGAAVVLLILAFVMVERGAAEPVMPLGLFKGRTFVMSSGISFVLGFAMFGVISYLPLYLQLVHGASATASGLFLLPLMAGVLTASLASGQFISRTGQYRWFPLVGTTIAAIGLFLLSTMTSTTNEVFTLGFMVVVGLGIGLVMQVVVLAAQNTASRDQIGVVTSSVTFFRSVGGAVGVAVFGSILNSRLSNELVKQFGSAARELAGVAGVQQIRALPAAIQDKYIVAFADALSGVFLYAVPFVLVGLILALFMPHVPLHGFGGKGHGEHGADSDDLDRELSVTTAVGTAEAEAATR
jgi:EmrB/QacA subfamily drug resistance transporter